jgi:transposase
VDLDARVRRSHPLRTFGAVVNEALGAMEREIASLYCGTARPSIAPERLLRARLLQAFYSIRSERQLMERIEFDLLFRWFVGLGMDDPVWDHSTFSKNRDRLLEGAVAARFLSAILAQPREETPVERPFQRRRHAGGGRGLDEELPTEGGAGRSRPSGRGRNPDADFRGEKRSNATYASTTDPDAKLSCKGPGMEARLCLLGHALMENRSGLVVDTCLTRAGGHTEKVAALDMIEPWAKRPRPVTLGADRGYDAADFVNELRTLNVRPHVAQNTARRSAIDGRTTRHAGYAASQRIRKRIEEAFGCMKSVDWPPLGGSSRSLVESALPSCAG